VVSVVAVVTGTAVVTVAAGAVVIVVIGAAVVVPAVVTGAVVIVVAGAVAAAVVVVRTVVETVVVVTTGMKQAEIAALMTKFALPSVVVSGTIFNAEALCGVLKVTLLSAPLIPASVKS
jgi:hypothetical protein